METERSPSRRERLALLELQVRLNASEVVSSFATDVREPLGRLQGLALPLDADALRDAVAGAGRIDVSALAAATERLIERVTGRDIDIPDPAQAVAGLRSVLELIEDMDPRKLEAAIRGAIDQAAAELRKPRTAGFDVVLERIVALLGASAEGKEVVRIIVRIIQLAGADAAILGEARTVVPAVLAVVRSIGGIMRVESALSEAERLTGIMRSQIGRESATLELASVPVALDYAVEQLMLAAGDAAALPEAERAAVEALQRIDVVHASIARRLGFAESTLLFADLDGTLRDVRLGLDETRDADLRAAGDAIGRLVDRVMPAFSLPLPPAPADSLDAMLRLIEAQVQEIADRIEAVDVTRIGAPVANLASAITAPVRDLERVGTELTVGARGAIERIADVIADLPTDELTQAVTAATAPVRDTLQRITGVIQTADAALRQMAGAATGAMGDAEQAVDTLIGALQAVVRAAADFVGELNPDAAIGQLDEQIQALRSTLEKASVRPYFAAAADAIDATASVLENVPVVLLPDDIKAEFDTLVEPIRSLDVDAVAGEVESWFALEAGRFPFEPTLEAALAEVRAQLDGLLAAVEPHHPRLLAQGIDAELAPLRVQLTRLDISQTLAPLEQGIASVRSLLDGIDPRAALAPVHDALETLASKLDEYSPSKLLAPLQQRIVDTREAVIDTLRLEAASSALTDLEREAVGLVTRLDPATLEPAIAAALDAARQEVGQLDRFAFSEWVGALLTSIMSGDGVRRRPGTWNTILSWLAGDEAASRLAARTASIAVAVSDSAAAVGALDLDAAAARVTSGLARLTGALNAFPQDAPIRVRLAQPLQRRGADGGFVALGTNRARFRGELDAAVAVAASLRQLEVARVDVAAAALRTVAAPVTRLRSQILGTLRQIGLRRPGDGLGAILAELLEVGTPERFAGILVPVVAALRGRAQALLGSILNPLRAALDDLVRLLRLIDLAVITQGLDDVVDAGKQQILALDPLAVLEPSLAAFDALRAEVGAFDPLAPLRAIVDTLRDTARRLLDKLSVERLIEPASQLFDALLETLRRLDVDAIVQPLVDALRILAADIRAGLEQLRSGLRRLQDAIPSSEGLDLAAVGVAVELDVDVPF